MEDHVHLVFHVIYVGEVLWRFAFIWSSTSMIRPRAQFSSIAGSQRGSPISHMPSVMFSPFTDSLRVEGRRCPDRVEGYPSVVLEGGREAGGYDGRGILIMVNIIDLIIGKAGRISWNRRFTSQSPSSSARPYPSCKDIHPFMMSQLRGERRGLRVVW